MKDKKEFSFNVVWLIWLFVLPGSLHLGSCDDNEPGSVAPPPPPTETEIGKAENWLTTGDQAKLLTKESDISIYTAKATTLPVITVNPAQTYQKMEGFGAALTGSSAYLINQKMTSSQRQNLLRQLFDADAGIGINALRLTIGASDFSLEDFTYNDMPAGQTDFTMANFSMEMENTDLFPVLKLANSLAPSMTIIGSPWSPPAWMKSNGSLKGGSLNTDAYDAYARYFVKYIETMKSQGITIDAITIQNEPLYSTANYPCMSMTAAEQRDFIKSNLGPMFEANSIATGIILYDHNWDNTQYAISIMNDADAKKYVLGTGFHAYGGSVGAMTTVHNAHPDKGLYFTEISGGEWATNFSDNLMWNMANIFIGTTKNWSKTVLLWNLALDQNFGPTNNGCNNCRGVVTIHSGTGVVTKNVEYYSIGHFSKFIRNGAFRVASSLSGTLPEVDYVAFLNESGKRVIVLSNSGSNPQTLAVKEGTKQFTLNIPAKAVMSVVWQ